MERAGGFDANAEKTSRSFELVYNLKKERGEMRELTAKENTKKTRVGLRIAE